MAGVWEDTGALLADPQGPDCVYMSFRVCCAMVTATVPSQIVSAFWNPKYYEPLYSLSSFSSSTIVQLVILSSHRKDKPTRGLQGGNSYNAILTHFLDPLLLFIKALKSRAQRNHHLLINTGICYYHYS